MKECRVDDVPAAFSELLGTLHPASVALSGGRTARACYEAVTEAGDDWSTTEFWFGDERWVPADDPDSNEGLARRVWLEQAETGPIHSLVGSGTTPALAAATYDSELRKAPRLEVVHLGLGSDGHTASLFPDSRALAVTDRWVVTAGDDQHPHQRVTLTFVALATVGQIVVTVAGAEKRAALAGVRAGNTNLPATRLATDATLAEKTIWLIDDSAFGR